MFRDLGVFEYHPRQRERFKSGELWQHWAQAFPDIFDAKDVEIARNQAGPPMNLHFFEWLAAVLIYHSFGYLSLLQQYEFKVHKRKRAVLRELLAPEVYQLVTNHRETFGGVQSPDLLVYAPDGQSGSSARLRAPKTACANRSASISRR